MRPGPDVLLHRGTSSVSRRSVLVWHRCRFINAVVRPGSPVLSAGPGAPGPEEPGWERGLVQSSGRLDDGGAAPIMRVRRTARCARGASRRGRPGCVGRRPRVAGAERGRPTVRRGWLGSARDAASWQPAPPSPAAGSSLVPLRPSRAEPPVAAIRSVRDVAGSASSTRYPTRMNGVIFALLGRVGSRVGPLARARAGCRGRRTGAASATSLFPSRVGAGEMGR